MFTLNTRELDQVIRDVHAAPEVYQREAKMELEVTAHMIKTNYRRNARPHMITGELDRSIDATQIGPWTWEIGSTKDYSWFNEGGTQEHKIPLEPKMPGDFPPFLHFFWEKKGIWVKFRQVTHPGTPALNWLYDANNEAVEPFPQTMGKRLATRFQQIKEI